MNVRRPTAVGAYRFFFPQDIVAKLQATISVVEDRAGDIPTTEMDQYRKGLLAALRSVGLSFGIGVSPDGQHVWNNAVALRGYSLEQVAAVIDAAYRARREVGTASSQIYRLGFETALQTLSTAFELEEDSGPVGIFQRLLGYT